MYNTVSSYIKLQNLSSSLLEMNTFNSVVNIITFLALVSNAYHLSSEDLTHE